MPGAILFQWGPGIRFELYPLNTHEYTHRTATDYARKEILQDSIRREWVGEGDEDLVIRGRIFPYKLGGMASLDAMDSERRGHRPHQLVRGTNPAWRLGWYVISGLERGHTFIGKQGVGRKVEFTAHFVRVGRPDAAEYANSVMSGAAGDTGYQPVTTQTTGTVKAGPV